MNIPMFVPSLALLRKWCEQKEALRARRIGRPARQDALISKPSNTPNPNTDASEALDYWLPLVDLNILPHLLRFDSFEDLLHQLEHPDIDEQLEAASAAMQSHNVAQRKSLSERWGSILDRARMHVQRPARAVAPTTPSRHNFTARVGALEEQVFGAVRDGGALSRVAALERALFDSVMTGPLEARIANLEEEL